MEWYTEGVTNAITTCRQQNALFIVYIKDDSGTSQAMDENWNCEEVQGVLTANKHVALQLQKDSLEHKQFDQLFPVLVYPCVFCINALSGKQLEVANGLQTPNQFRVMLQNAFMKLSGAASEHIAPAASQAAGSSEFVPQEASSEEPEKSESNPPAPRRPERSVDELRQEVRKKRADSEREKKKREELQRRQHSQDVASFRQEQDDRRNQAWILERRKQKEEERRAREEVRAKLEQDRQERLAQKQALKATTPTSDSGVRQRESRTAGVKSTASSCRVQVKLPGGGSTVFTLAPSDPLSVLRTKVAQHLKASESKISLFATYPQRELSSEQDTESMTTLNLMPSAVVLAKMSKGMLSSGGDGGSGGVFGLIISLFQFLVQLLVMLKNGIVGLFSSPSTTAQSHSSQSTNAARVKKFRQEDYDDDKDDKKKSTYNGNSTQQQ